MTDGEKKFQEIGEKLRKERIEREEKENKEKAIVASQIDQLSQNSQLAKMYSDSAKVGAGNLAGELPLLKVHAIGKSNKNLLSSGSEPTDGWFFYKPTGEQFENPICHILTISRGYRAQGLEGKEDQFNQIVGGVIIDEEEMKPFVMYITGLKLSYLWDFGKEASKYTRMRPIPIPMFALFIKLSTKKIDSKFGRNWIIEFEIQKMDDGSPRLVLDSGEFQYLKDNVATVEETISSLISSKTVKGEVDPEVAEIFTDKSEKEKDPIGEIPF